MINGVLVVVLVFLALMLGGLVGAWAIWPTAERHGYAEGESDRHRHRLGDPQETTLLALPRAGRIPLERLADPAPLPGEGPPWLFAGEQDPGWAAEAAEYEWPHQPEVGSLDWTAQKLAEVQADEQLTDTGAMRALTDERIAKMVGDTNEFIFGLRVF